MTRTLIRPIALAALLGAVVLAACSKYDIEDPTTSLPGSSVRFSNFAVGAPGVNFFADTTRLTGVSTNKGVTYGAAALGGLYAGLKPGSYTLSGRLADTTANNFPIGSVSTAIDFRKSYSFYLSGIFNPADSSVDAFVVEDPIPTTLVDTLAYVRFVNAIGNADSLRLYVRLSTDTLTADWMPVDSVVTYKTAGPFIMLAAQRYDLAGRLPDSTTNKFTHTGVAFAGGHVYTITARGNITVASGTAAPFLDASQNR